MIAIRSYLLSVLAASIICAILKQFFKEKNGVTSVIHLVAGMFLAVTALRPVLSISFSGEWKDMQIYKKDASAMIIDGEAQAEAALEAHIKKEVQAYILEEASQLNANVSVEVLLSNEEWPRPVQVTVQGAVSPYAKARLSEIMMQELGVPKESQVWID